MLTSVLPGLRELRTPLAVGWTWLGVLLLALGPFVLPRSSTTGVMHDIYALEEAVGKGTALVVSSFVAYLLGSLVQVERIPRLPRLSRLLYESPEEDKWEQRPAHFHGSRDSFFDVQRLVQRIAEDLSPTATGTEAYQFIPAEGPDEIAAYVLSQRTILETRLLADKRDVYDFYDRLVESAILRLNLAPAVFVLAVVLGMRIGFERAWGIGLAAITVGSLLSLVLLARAGHQESRADTVLATAVATELVKSPYLEKWQARAVRWNAENESPPRGEGSP